MQKTAFCNGGRFQAASQGRRGLAMPLKSKRILSGMASIENHIAIFVVVLPVFTM